MKIFREIAEIIFHPNISAQLIHHKVGLDIQFYKLCLRVASLVTKRLNPNLTGRGLFQPPCWSSPNISKSIVTLTNQKDIKASNNFSVEPFIPNLVFLIRPSLQALGKTQIGVFSVSEFLVRSLINNLLYFHNSRTSNGFEPVMKLGSVTKHNKRNTTTSKKIDDDFVSATYGVIVIFRLCRQFEAIRKIDSGRTVYNS